MAKPAKRTRRAISMFSATARKGTVVPLASVELKSSDRPAKKKSGDSQSDVALGEISRIVSINKRAVGDLINMKNLLVERDAQLLAMQERFYAENIRNRDLLIKNAEQANEIMILKQNIGALKEDAFVQDLIELDDE